MSKLSVGLHKVMVDAGVPSDTATQILDEGQHLIDAHVTELSGGLIQPGPKLALPDPEALAERIKGNPHWKEWVGKFSPEYQAVLNSNLAAELKIAEESLAKILGIPQA